jgi:paraquat-inducible protein B
MTVIYKNLSFAMLAVTAMSLLIFGIVQNASATSSEIRMLADLNPTDGGIAADGRADYRERGNSMRLNVEVEDVSPNTTFTVEISGNTLGTITTNSFGTAKLELNTNDGQVVPKVLRGDLVQIFQGIELVLSGAFDGDGNIENGGQAPITPNQNSVMQAGNSSTNLFTVPSSNTTLQDAPVTVTNSSSNNATIQNLQQQIVALQQTVDALQQALMALQSGPQEGNVTISSGNNNNNTAVSPIQ